MYRRIITLMLAVTLGLPAAALADASANGLGPASSTSGSSSADGGVLQPAGSSIQSPTGAGLSSSADAANALQQPATTDNQALQVLMSGSVDGSSKSGGESIWWSVLWIVVGLAIIAAGALAWFRHPMIKLAGLKKASPSAKPAPVAATIGQSDETPPLEVGETTDKTGDSGGKARKAKKHGKKKSGRRGHR